MALELHARLAQRLRFAATVVLVAALGWACGGPTPPPSATSTPASPVAIADQSPSAPPAVTPAATPGSTAPSSDTPPPRPSPTASPTSRPTDPPGSYAPPAGWRPASGHVTVRGSAGLAGDWRLVAIRCSVPNLGSLTLLASAIPPNAKLAATISLGNGLHVRLRTGSGATYREEDFSMAGASTADPTRGATFGTTTTATGGGPAYADLGRIDALEGSIDCGDQHLGTSTLTFAGSGPDGPIELNRDVPSGEPPSFDPVRVECDPGVVLVTGTGWAGHGLANVTLSIQPNAISLTTQSSGSDETHSYSVKGTGVAGLTGAGAHVNATLSARLQFGSQSRIYRVRVSGDVTCGAFGRI